MSQYGVTHKSTVGELMPVLTEVVEAESHDEAVDIVQKMFPKNQVLATQKGIFKQPEPALKTWKFWMQPRNSKSAPVEEILVQGKDINEATSKAIAKKPGHIWLGHEEIAETEQLTVQELNAEIADSMDEVDPVDEVDCRETAKADKAAEWRDKFPLLVEGQDEGPVAPDPRIEQLEQVNLRLHDKLYLIERLAEQQVPFGSDLANFRRRILLMARA